METITITSFLIFGILSLIVLFIMINVSSIIAMAVLLLLPVISIIAVPGVAIPFFSHQHMLLAEGLVPINNLHILLFIWSTMIGIILYTEFLTWYLSDKKVTASK